ncbi:hypothetical protein JHK87_005905 [Glycine soja]|nr:hypothetical protein JHK87_005905 [Glycine soja]
MGAAKGENVCASPSPEISKEVDPSHASETLRIVNAMGAATPIPANCNARGFYDAFLRSFIKVDHIQRGRISCTVVAKPPICTEDWAKLICSSFGAVYAVLQSELELHLHNLHSKEFLVVICNIRTPLLFDFILSLERKNRYGTLHGGSVGSLVEILSNACARTVVAKDKELFLGEISISYLSATPANEEVLANASVVKTGRNLTVVAVEFKLKKAGNLLYITHSTFYNMPVASL